MDHEAGERAIAQAHGRRDVNGVNEGSGFAGGQYRGLAFPDRVFRTPNRTGGVGCNKLADDEPVKEHANPAKCHLTEGEAGRVRRVAT